MCLKRWGGRSEATSSHRLRRGSTLALRGRGIKPRPWPKGNTSPLETPGRGLCPLRPPKRWRFIPAQRSGLSRHFSKGIRSLRWHEFLPFSPLHQASSQLPHATPSRGTSRSRQFPLDFCRWNEYLWKKSEFLSGIAFSTRKGKPIVKAERGEVDLIRNREG